MRQSQGQMSKPLDRMTLEQLVGHVERLRITWENTRGADAIAAAWRAYETAQAVLTRRMEFVRSGAPGQGVRGTRLATINQVRSHEAAARALLRAMHANLASAYVTARTNLEDALEQTQNTAPSREDVNGLLAPMALALRTCATDMHAALLALHALHTQSAQPNPGSTDSLTTLPRTDSTSDASPNLPPPPDPYEEP